MQLELVCLNELPDHKQPVSFQRKKVANNLPLVKSVVWCPRIEPSVPPPGLSHSATCVHSPDDCGTHIQVHPLLKKRSGPGSWSPATELLLDACNPVSAEA